MGWGSGSRGTGGGGGCDTAVVFLSTARIDADLVRSAAERSRGGGTRHPPPQSPPLPPARGPPTPPGPSPCGTPPSPAEAHLPPTPAPTSPLPPPHVSYTG